MFLPDSSESQSQKTPSELMDCKMMRDKIWQTKYEPLFKAMAYVYQLRDKDLLNNNYNGLNAVIAEIYHLNLSDEIIKKAIQGHLGAFISYIRESGKIKNLPQNIDVKTTIAPSLIRAFKDLLYYENNVDLRWYLIEALYESSPQLLTKPLIDEENITKAAKERFFDKVDQDAKNIRTVFRQIPLIVKAQSDKNLEDLDKLFADLDAVARTQNYLEIMKHQHDTGLRPSAYWVRFRKAADNFKKLAEESESKADYDTSANYYKNAILSLLAYGVMSRQDWVLLNSYREAKQLQLNKRRPDKSLLVTDDYILVSIELLAGSLGLSETEASSLVDRMLEGDKKIKTNK